MIIGQCLLDYWPAYINEYSSDHHIERILFNNGVALPELTSAASYDFQVIAPPLRSIMPESQYMPLKYVDLDKYESIFEESCNRLEFIVRSMLKYNIENNILTFVSNFFTPIKNPMGQLLPRYDLRNPIFFVEQLNVHLSKFLGGFSNIHLLDTNQISSTIGKRYVQDDSVSIIVHGSPLVDHAVNIDEQRIEKPSQSITSKFNADNYGFVCAVWDELISMYRTIMNIDSVKMVVMDLDDTLWRGIAGESGSIDPMMQIEGWPLGVAEALTYLKRRGIILAIVSKNEESVVRNLWLGAYQNRLDLDKFSFIRINWKPKYENILELIKIANILPSSVVFVDDNPVERESVMAAIPGIRVLGDDPYLTRTALLWASETQVRYVTDESGRRGEMMKAQEQREIQKVAMSRPDFLLSQNIKIKFDYVLSKNDKKYPRAFELINKTNQFNTTGKRWTEEEMAYSFNSGIKMAVFHVDDRFTNYGLVGVILISGSRIIQFVMSCRVLGMDVELGVLCKVCTDILNISGNGSDVNAFLTHTDANFPCRDLYQKANFILGQDSSWHLKSSLLPKIPTHLNFAV
ncbi:HAD-IIIC family phosphatase [Rhodoferax sp.]|uniref:HAD-IIIC family phosphatase n=1 Tax=Rhodoferax sp. TaxID=50421 RepID=UPI0025D46DCC|nr:HAD-IIIC family phosphatase [Rhodoferax sp.]